jgi:hypothetical protein
MDMDFSSIRLPKGVQMRKPYPSEVKYFKDNPKVAGMATEDGRVILNPFTGLSLKEYQAVATNESARLLIKKEDKLKPDFKLTDYQTQFLDFSTYRYASEEDRKATIAARILSGDPSAGVPTPEQLIYVETLKQRLQDE